MNQAEQVLRRLIADRPLTDRQEAYFRRIEKEEFDKYVKTPVGKIAAMLTAGATIAEMLMHPTEVAEATQRASDVFGSALGALLGEEPADEPTSPT